jgi:xanthine dehydrogenase accessory factor
VTGGDHGVGGVEGWDVLAEANDLASRGEDFALATVVWRQTPSSGQVGSRAIVTADGELRGWIGGACAEPVVVREAQRIIADGTPKLLLLGTPGQFGSAVPEGMTVIPISCGSDGALEVYVEPVTTRLSVILVGHSPMTQTLATMITSLGWHAELRGPGELSTAEVDEGSIVIVATQGHGDEDAVAAAVSGHAAFVGLVASRRRAESVLGYLAEHGVSGAALDRVHAPVGLDLGRTSHREIAVAILAELVQLRAAGRLRPNARAMHDAPRAVPDAADPVCGMTVAVDGAAHVVDHGGVRYYFCGARCRDAFLADPQAYAAANVTGGDE